LILSSAVCRILTSIVSARRPNNTCL
jgi:hypothetical protein